jgi:hypothetical protein
VSSTIQTIMWLSPIFYRNQLRKTAAVALLNIIKRNAFYPGLRAAYRRVAGKNYFDGISGYRSQFKCKGGRVGDWYHYSADICVQTVHKKPHSVICSVGHLKVTGFTNYPHFRQNNKAGPPWWCLGLITQETAASTVACAPCVIKIRDHYTHFKFQRIGEFFPAAGLPPYIRSASPKLAEFWI